MIEAEAVDAQLVFAAVQQLGQFADELAGGVADAVDPALEAGFDDRLGHHAGRIGEVEQHRVRRGKLLDQAAIVEDRRNRTHRHGEAAGAGGFLPKQLVIERDALVMDAAFLAADAQGGDDVVGALQRGAHRC